MRWTIKRLKTTRYSSQPKQTREVLRRIRIWMHMNKGNDKIEQYEHMKMQRTVWEAKR